MPLLNDKIVTRLFALITLMLINITASAATTSIDSSLAPMLKNVLPAVVNIRAQLKMTDAALMREMLKRRGNLQPSENYSSVASGVIINAKNGYILTNAHVVDEAEVITIALSDGRHFRAKLIGMDKPSDVAVLKINAKNLTAMKLGNSSDLNVGDYVAAIGNPFGLNQTVTSGIISALGRTTLGIEGFENFIQTDAPINPGNSGGALINMNGELIGINTAILAPDRGSIGIGFAIPVNMAIRVMQQILEYGDVKRGVLGIGTQNITPDMANAFGLKNSDGAVVTQVIPGSPAQQGGLMVGDIIKAINNETTKTANDVVNTIGFLRVDSRIKVSILRQTKPLTISVTLTDPKARKEQLADADPFLFGLAMKDFSLDSPIHGNVNGVLVVSVDPESKAWQYELRPGDVITQANGKRVANIDELKNEVKKTGNALLLNVLRGEGAIFIVINKSENG